MKNVESGKTITWVIFLVTLTAVIISLASAVFPALILSDSQTVKELKSLGIPQVGPDRFEGGVWAGPIIATSLVVFIIYFLYVQEKLPRSLSGIFKKIFSFEVSKKVSLGIIIVLLGIYIIVSANELTTEEIWKDYQDVKDKAENRPVDSAFRSFDVPLKFFFLSSSILLFDNIRVIPFIASISLLLLTYVITAQISKKRFAGIVAMGVLLQSSLFLSYDTTATYENFWILFYLISLYTIYRFWPLSPITYILSTLAKPLTLVFLPMSVLFIVRSSLVKRKKILVLLGYLGTVIISIALVVSLGINVSGRSEDFKSQEFWMGFTSLAYQLRFDGLILLFLLPLIVGLFIASRKNVKTAESVMILICGMLLVTPFLSGFTIETNQPYRLVPLVVFFAIGVGTLLSKRQVE